MVGKRNMEDTRLVEYEADTSPNVSLAPRVSFSVEGSKLVKKTEVGSLCGCLEIEVQTPLSDPSCQKQLARDWGLLNLKMKRNPSTKFDQVKCLNIADFFCGAGGLSLGVSNALRSVGIGLRHVVACDRSQDSLNVYNANFSPEKMILDNVENLLRIRKIDSINDQDIPVAADIDLSPEIDELIGKVDIFVAGPPCEGNSNLNNKTRRVDLRNNHYISAALLGARLGAEIIIIENVQTVQRAKQNVVEVAKLALSQAGYNVNQPEYLLKAENFNVAQKRIRHFLIAVKNSEASGPVDFSGLLLPPLSAMDAIGDLVDCKSSNIMDVCSNLSEENVDRIKYLFENDLYDLPDSERPVCHRDKEHSYYNVYGRMFPDHPAYTITTGFQSPGRGRYVHPTRKRGLTPREGARLQGFPDSFKWRTPLCRVPKQSITRLIGDAVPPNLGEAAMLIALALCNNVR